MLKNFSLRLAAIGALLLAIFLPQHGYAQSSSPGATSLCGTASLAVTTSSTRVQLPIASANCRFLILRNDGASELFYNPGDVTAVATTSSFFLAPGDYIVVQASQSVGYIAAITSSSTTTLRLIQSAAMVNVSSGGSGSGGGGGGGSVTQGTTPWVENVSQFGGNNVVTGTGASGVGIPRVTVSNDSSVGIAQGGNTAAVSAGGALSVSPGAATVVSTTMQNAAVANGNGTVLNTAGMGAAALTVNCATCATTTINFEGTQDGTNYSPIYAQQLGTTTFGLTTTASGLTYWQIPVTGLQNIRARISVYASGTVTITGTATPDAPPMSLGVVNVQGVAAGTPVVGNITQFGGVAIATGVGVSGTGIPRVTVSSDSTVILSPSATNTFGITPVVSASAEGTHVLKNTAGSLYSVTFTNLTATAGFLVVINATAAPADGAITPLACVPVPANGSATISYGIGPPAVYSTGISAVITSAATCFTKTTGTVTGFFAGAVK